MRRRREKSYYFSHFVPNKLVKGQRADEVRYTYLQLKEDIRVLCKGHFATVQKKSNTQLYGFLSAFYTQLAVPAASLPFVFREVHIYIDIYAHKYSPEYGLFL